MDEVVGIKATIPKSGGDKTQHHKPGHYEINEEDRKALSESHVAKPQKP